MGGQSLRGKLLIAAPVLQDYFRRSVVLVVEHGAEGALGVILNRRSDVRVGDAVSALAELGFGDEPLFIGGPVQPTAVIALGEFGDPEEASSIVVGTLGVLDPERPPTSLSRIRVYAGYAGWAPGQLERELEQEAWIVEAASPEDPFLDGDLWRVVLRRKGGPYALLATMPSDPALN